MSPLRPIYAAKVSVKEMVVVSAKTTTRTITSTLVQKATKSLGKMGNTWSQVAPPQVISLTGKRNLPVSAMKTGSAQLWYLLFNRKCSRINKQSIWKDEFIYTTSCRISVAATLTFLINGLLLDDRNSRRPDFNMTTIM